MFRLVVYDTKSDSKWEADSSFRYQVIGDRFSIFGIWFHLSEELHMKYVEVYNMDGRLQDMHKGLVGMEEIRP